MELCLIGSLVCSKDANFNDQILELCSSLGI